jgi:hypothetical protein
MKKTKILSIILSLMLVSIGLNLYSNVGYAAPQTLIILGAQGTPGETDPYTEFTLDNGQTWNQAYLYGSHPWGFVPGTNSWINIGPSGTGYGINQTVLYRVRFNVPEGSIDPKLTFDVKADNYATIWLNGTYVKDIEGAGGTSADATVNGAVHSGMNEIKLLVRDTGGWAGFNYKITLNVDAPTPPTVIDTIAPTASVSYSNVNPTNQNVVSTITPSEPVTITNNGGSASYAFSENGSFTFEFIDATGNKGSAIATVANIDKIAPTATVAYNKTTPTNQDVIATITPSEAVTITNNGGSKSYTYTQNGSFTFNFVDAAGNTGSVIATVANIDKIAPTATVAYNTTAPTNQDVIATITPSEDVTITNNGGSTSFSFAQNDSFTFNFVDAAGNTGSVIATVANIDKIAPTATVAYNTTAPTNQDVIATITPSEEVTITNNDGSKSYTFTQNGSFTFNFVDAVGNTGSVVATVTNIDKVAPTATVAYDIIASTNHNVVATITPSEDITITNNGGSNSYTFTQNGSFTFNFVDAVGNLGSVIATVSNIDRIAPTLRITLDHNDLNPPNHKMVKIHATLTSQDNNSGSLSIILKSITSNEPDNGLGDGDTQNDIQGANFGTLDTDFELRAERSGKGKGRIYTITYTITDAAGNQSTAIATVVVNHDSSKK